MQELISKIEQWAIDRELDKKATVEAQSIKTAEEMAELIIGISKDNLEVIKDSIGDVFVTLVVGNMIYFNFNMEKILSRVLKFFDAPPKVELIHDISLNINNIVYKKYMDSTISLTIMCLLMVCNTYDLDFIDCVESAYNEIKDRKGKTIDGQFIKESDL
mgnify:CR=1 FL=1